MRVKELIEELQKLDSNLEVYVSRDPEGNGFIKCSGAWEYLTFSDTNDYQFEDIYSEEDAASEGYEMSDFRKVVIIWP